MNEEELERLAAEEILREAKQGAARAVLHGALGWKKDSVPRPNKRFLSTTLAHTMQYNYRRSRSRSSSPHHSRGVRHSRNSTHQSRVHKKTRTHSQPTKQNKEKDKKHSENIKKKKKEHSKKS